MCITLSIESSVLKGTQNIPTTQIYGAFCCKSSSKEKRSKRWEYKRGHGKKEGHYFSHKYSQAVCMDYDPLWYMNVHVHRHV